MARRAIVGSSAAKVLAWASRRADPRPLHVAGCTRSGATVPTIRACFNVLTSSLQCPPSLERLDAAGQPRARRGAGGHRAAARARGRSAAAASSTAGRRCCRRCPDWRVSRHAGGPARMVRRRTPPQRAGRSAPRCDASNPALVMARWAAGERPRVEVQGDAAFAADVQLADRQPALGPARTTSRASSARRRRTRSRASASCSPTACAARRARCRRAGRRAPATPGPRPAMRHFARLVFIVFTVLRFGLDELALSGFRQRWVRAAGRA